LQQSTRGPSRLTFRRRTKFLRRLESRLNDPEKTSTFFALNSLAIYLGGTIEAPLGAIALRTSGGGARDAGAIAFLAVLSAYDSRKRA
jgi:predicted MFS family arabinose efflux permease